MDARLILHECLMEIILKIMNPFKIEGAISCVIMVSYRKKDWQHHVWNLDMEGGTILLNSTEEEINQDNWMNDQFNPGFCRATLVTKLRKPFEKLTH